MEPSVKFGEKSFSAEDDLCEEQKKSHGNRHYREIFRNAAENAEKIKDKAD